VLIIVPDVGSCNNMPLYLHSVVQLYSKISLCKSGSESFGHCKCLPRIL